MIDKHNYWRARCLYTLNHNLSYIISHINSDIHSHALIMTPTQYVDQ